MNFNIKRYKYNNLKKKLKKKFFFIYFGSNKNANKTIITQQNLNNLNLKHYNIKNSLIKKALILSIFKNYEIIAQAPTLIIYLKKNTSKYKLNLKEFIDLTNNNQLLGLKLNNKIYKIKQIKKILLFSYNFKIQSLYLLLKSVVKKVNIKI